MDYDLGYFDLETRVLEPLENPFGPTVVLFDCGDELAVQAGPEGIQFLQVFGNPIEYT